MYICYVEIVDFSWKGETLLTKHIGNKWSFINLVSGYNINHGHARARNMQYVSVTNVLRIYASASLYAYWICLETYFLFLLFLRVKYLIKFLRFGTFGNIVRHLELIITKPRDKFLIKDTFLFIAITMFNHLIWIKGKIFYHRF